MKNTLENEMLDAAISWCDSNGINVLGPEQLSHLVNSLYVTVCDATLDTAQPVQPERAPSDAFLQMAIISFGLLIQGDFDLPENAQELAKRAVPLMGSVLHDDDDPITIVFAAIEQGCQQ